jgi:hypothetical protein
VLSLAVPAMADTSAVSRDEVRALVAEMMNDAQNRTSLLQGGGTAGHDAKGFFMASGDGKFRLNVGGFTQFTYYMNFRDDQAAGTLNNDFEPGFQVKRARLEFKGNVVSPDLTFMVSEELSSTNSDGDGGNASLKDAWFDYSFGNGWYIKGGQFKLNFLREENISDTYQLASERSAVNSVFTQDRSQGVEFGYRDEQFRVNFSFNDGFNSDNTPFAGPNAVQNISQLPENDFGMTFRAEWNFMGSVDTLKDFTSKPDGEWAAMVGAAFHYQQSANADTDVAGNSGAGAFVDLNYLSYTIDLQIEGAGFNGFLAFVGNNVEGRPAVVNTGDEDSADDFGIVAQIGYRFGDWEPFVRYDGLFLDDDAETGRVFTTTSDTNDNLSFLTAGVNYYCAGHAAKITADAVYCFDANNFTTTGGIPVGTGGNFVGSTSGILADGQDSQIVLRFQFQLMF